MPVYKIKTTDIGPTGKHWYMNIESEAPNLDAFAADLRAGPIAVDKLKTRRIGVELEIIERKRILITTAFVVMAEDAGCPVFEMEDARPADTADNHEGAPA